METKNTIYDFTMPAKRPNIEEIIETLTVKQIQEVADFAEELKQKETQQKRQFFLNWMKTAILPIWKNYSHKTSSVLEVQETDEEIHILIWNKNRFDIYSNDTDVKFAIGLATYLGIDYVDAQVRLDLVYSLQNEND